MHVLAAVDASRDSRNAARMVLHLAQPAEVDVLYVVDLETLKHTYLATAVPAGYYESYRREIAEAAEQVLHQVKTELAPHVKQIRLIADTGDPAESLIQTAEESRPDMILVGQRGMTAEPTFLLGGVSQKAALYAPCSVLVVKEPAVVDHLLLAVDGSEESDKAVRLLAGAPFKGRPRLTVVTAWAGGRTAPFGAAPPSGLDELAAAKGQELLRTVAQTLGTDHYEVRTEMLDGDPAFAILEAAARHGAHMIVLGSRGIKAIKRFLLGSVSQKVLVHAPCSVLIVR